MRLFVDCVEAGDFSRELAEDCIVSLFARSTKGLAGVMGFMRTQIAGRFKHTGFEEARVCDASHENYLHDRFGHSLEKLRNRLKTQMQSQKKLDRPTTWLSRAESVEDMTVNIADPVTPPNQLVTPPRSGIPATATYVSNTEAMQYIEAIGVLEPVTGPMDDDPCQVKLTLGYRHGSTPHNGELDIEFCLIVYEKYKQTRSQQRQQRLRSPPGNVYTDDEGDEPAPRSVRRILFRSADCEQVEDMEPIVTPSPKPVLPRKRPHNDGPNRKSKRAVRLSRLRF